ncbi:unnamed protein product [marine sediment metagenome]|jgi:hypothetical protein|uniref:Uncharacterized protein n=1 Tax=marine sediment metagenome TaxID=412755 RepID=X1U3X8_9ZZZZ
MEIKVEKPKEIYQEIRGLIDTHYSLPVGSKEPFGKEYPQIYKLYLAIAAAGLNK